MPTTRRIESDGSLPSVGALALIVALVVALLGAWSARPDQPVPAESRVRIGLFDRARLDPRADDRLERTLAGVGGDLRLAWIGARTDAPAWLADDVEVVDVTEALRARLAGAAK